MHERIILDCRYSSIRKQFMKLLKICLTLGGSLWLLVSGMMAVAAGAATVETDNGSRLVGVITKIHDGTVHIKPDFSDEIRIPLSRVVRIESDESVSIRTRAGDVQSGVVRTPREGTVEVSSPTGTITAPIGEIASAWQPGSQDPIIVAEQAALSSQIRRWSYQAGADISGRSGNSQNLTSSVHLRATLEGPRDRLEFYGSYTYAETDGRRGADEIKAGSRFTSYFTEKIGWFVRTELERDTFEGIDFRSTNAAGLSYRFIREKHMELEGSAGISYRYEDYIAGGSEDFPGLDFGLRFRWRFADWGRLNSVVSYVPSVENFNEYLLEQDTGIEIPLATSDFWRMRIGLNNKYNNRPDPGRKSLDTAYYVRLILSWD